MQFIVEPAKKVMVGLYKYPGGDPEIPDKTYPAIILSYNKGKVGKLLRFFREVKVNPDEAEVTFNTRKEWVDKDGFVDVQIVFHIERGKNCWTVTGEAEMKKETIEMFKKEYKRCGYFILSLGYGEIPTGKKVLIPQWRLVLNKYMEIS